jgi:MoaA/NifB/PqqE/SkfB family radical SAM enzyme
VSKFATVLQLEPLHTCNLACTGCGRIREYASTLKQMMTLDDCLEAAAQCDAPMISICGGEPLIYPQIEALVAGLHAQKRIVYLCTNALLMRRKMKEYVAAQWVKNPDKTQPVLDRLIAGNLISHEDASAIRNRGNEPAKAVIEPSRWFYWNVHLDGLEATHDRIVERTGVFREAILAIRMAKILGYQVATNTTVYKETDMAEIENLLIFLASLNVDGHTLSPGYDFGDAGADMIRRGRGRPEDFFLTRSDTVEKFRNVEEWGRRFPLLGTPV